MVRRATKEELQQWPENWWLDPHSSKQLRNYLERHVVGLHVEFRQNGQLKDDVFTGIVFQHGGYAFWLTAGHVIKTMRSMKDDATVEIIGASFFDHSPPSLGGAIPVDLNHLISNRSDSDSIDFGLVLLRPGYRRLLQSNPRIEFLDERIWNDLSTAKTEGHFLLGYPGEWLEVLVGPGATRTVRTGIACLPLEFIEDRGAEANLPGSDFWGHSECVYAQLVPLNAEERRLVESILGMSGGPIFSVRREGDGIPYRLFGIQSEWLPDSRIIRCGRIPLIAELMDTTLRAIEAVVQHQALAKANNEISPPGVRHANQLRQ